VPIDPEIANKMKNAGFGIGTAKNLIPRGLLVFRYF